MYNNTKRVVMFTLRIVSMIVMTICIICIIIPSSINGSANDNQNTFSVSVLVKLQKYLICDGELDANEVNLYDVDNNGILNAVDLVLIKQNLIKQSSEEEGTTTTSTTTSMTTTSTTIEWTPPTQEDIINPEGFSPSDEEYEGLIASAELFGLEYYKIIWTDELIEYSLVIPSNTYATIANLGDWICFQVCPIQDAEKILPEYNWKETGHNLAVWRPETDGINFNTCSKDLYWDGHYGFVIIPLKPNEEGQLVEDLRLLYPISE